MFYLHARTTVDAVTYAPDEPGLLRLREQAKDLQFEPQARIKMAQVLRSVVSICGYLRDE